MSILLAGVIRNGRVEFPNPVSFPEGTEVIVSVGEPEMMTEQEIARTLAAMQLVQPLDIPQDIADDLEAWERKLNQHGIDNADRGIEDVFR